jgi:hypothetical protein
VPKRRFHLGCSQSEIFTAAITSEEAGPLPKLPSYHVASPLWVPLSR